MKHYTLLYIMAAMMSLFLLPSCSESDDTVEEYPNWKATNEAYWNNLYKTTETAIYCANGRSKTL